MRNKYHRFDKTDFLEDPFFLEWIKYNTPESALFWENWKASSPPNLDKMEAAAAVLKAMLSFERIVADPEAVQAGWAHIEHEVKEKQPNKHRLLRRRFILRAAAAVAGILLAGIWFTAERYWGRNTVTAGYGDIQTVTLPDSSTVTVNANTTLQYAKYWKKDTKREVWLEGEAYFRVARLKNDKLPLKESERFVVHTPELDIEVLGTVFNVKDRHGIIEIMLESGSVAVINKTAPSQSWALAPGDLLRFHKASRKADMIQADSAVHTAWTRRQMILNNTPVKEIIRQLEDHFGKTIIPEDTLMVQRRLNGVFPMSDYKDALFVLSRILKAKAVQQDEDTTLLKPRDKP